MGAAVVAALSIPLDRPGVGWLCSAFAAVVALMVARRLGNRPVEPLFAGLRVWDPAKVAAQRLGPQRYLWSAATVALIGVGTVRAAGWLFLLCLATAVGTAALAIAGGRSSRGMLMSVQMSLLAPFKSLPWALRGAARIRRRKAGGARVIATVAVSVILLLVFGLLFSSADAAFAAFITKALPDVDAGTVVRWVFVGGVSAAMIGGAAYLRAAPPDLSGLDGRGTRRVARFEWAVPLGLLVLLFAAFVGVQLTVLFGGSDHVLRTAHLTYADYARSGFGQLAVVTVLTLIVITLAARWAPRETGTDRALIRVLLGSLAGLTLVIVASALHRMNLYSDTYGLTRLRILVALCELWLAAVFILILIAGIRLTGGWLPRTAVALGVLSLLGLAAANPDALIAERNVARYQQTQRIDENYLAGLSADAIPALTKLPEPKRGCILPSASTYQPTDWRSWNYGTEQAIKALTTTPPTNTCTQTR